MALADFEVVEVVRRGDLHRAGAGLRVGIVVGDDLQLAADQRQDGVLADEVLVALVVRMDRDAGVAQHRLRARGRHHDETIGFPFNWVFEVPEMALGLDLLHFQIGDRGLQLRIPVDQPLVLVDQPIAVEVDEDLDHRLGQALVHGEAFAAPVAGGAEALQLVEDHAA